MNDERRKKLGPVAAQLDSARGVIEEIKQDEEEAYENLPESMQQSEKGEKIQAALEALNEASDAIDQAIDHLSTACE